MTVYVKKPKKPTKQLLDLASDHSKVADFEINMQKSVVFLYSSNEHMDTINAISLTTCCPFMTLQLLLPHSAQYYTM